MTRHLYTVKATACELTIVLDALSRALAEADGDLWEATRDVERHPDDSLYATFLRLASTYKQSVQEGRDTFLRLFYDAQDEEGNFPHYGNEAQRSEELAG